jgi:phosphohistidine phosphatase
MLRLILLRHGKSSWDGARLEDFDRPLSPRGLHNVPEMGRRLARRGTLPELIVSSTEVRALSTARAIAREIDYPEDHIGEAPELYLASPREILAIVRQAPAATKCLMVVGHNPGLTELANQFDAVRIDNMPTAGMLCAESDVSGWTEFEPGKARFCWFDYPKKQPG